jgi:uncharacterized protein
MKTLFSFIAGLTFGIGLIIAGMANPAKVIGFLDLAGNWDPSLALVMAGAIAVGSIAFAIASRRTTTLLGSAMALPGNRTIDRRLIIGSLTFGIGWGLAGICPGPAVVLLGSASIKGLVFFAAMLLGMLLFSWRERGVQRVQTQAK